VIGAARRQHRSWGPAKLLAWLRPRHAGVAWPAISTAGDLLARRGLVKKRRRRRMAPTSACTRPSSGRPVARRSRASAPNNAFNAFRRLYNDERPHEALGERPPATQYRPSARPYTGTLPPVEYLGHFLVKRVTNAGTIRLKKRLLFLSNALQQHPVGLEEVGDGIWSIHFCQVLLGRVDGRDYVIWP
jgi:hypothetical protein